MWGEILASCVLLQFLYVIFVPQQESNIEKVEYKDGNFYLEKGDRIKLFWKFGDESPSMSGDIESVIITRDKNVAFIRFYGGIPHKYTYK